MQRGKKVTCMLVVLLLALLLSDSLIPAVTNIKFITFCLHTKMMKTHNPWRVFIPSKMYLKWSAKSIIENIPSECLINNSTNIGNRKYIYLTKLDDHYLPAKVQPLFLVTKKSPFPWTFSSTRWSCNYYEMFDTWQQL